MDQETYQLLRAMRAKLDLIDQRLVVVIGLMRDNLKGADDARLQALIDTLSENEQALATAVEQAAGMV